MLIQFLHLIALQASTLDTCKRTVINNTGWRNTRCPANDGLPLLAVVLSLAKQSHSQDMWSYSKLATKQTDKTFDVQILDILYFIGSEAQLETTFPSARFTFFPLELPR